MEKEETKRERSLIWKNKENLIYPSIKKSGSKWVILTQDKINIKPNEYKLLSLNLGYEIKEGIIFISPVGDLNLKLEIKNNVFIEEKTEDIKVYVFNFTKDNFFIPENKPFCYVKFFKN